MAIERDGDDMQLVCDATGRRHPRTFDRDDFERMIADAKDDGWRVQIEAGVWRHYAPVNAGDDMGAVNLED